MPAIVHMLLSCAIFVVMSGQLATGVVIPGVAQTTGVTGITGDGRKVVAAALLRDELFVTREGDDHVSVYDATSLQLGRRIAIPGLGRWAGGLATCSLNNFLYVSDYYGNCIHRVALSTNDDVTRVDLLEAGRPLGLSVNRRHNLLVASNRSVNEYTPNGELVGHTPLDNDLWQAVETINGTLIVSRTGPTNSIAELTRDGRVLRSYGDQPGSGDGQLNSPRSLALDSKGSVFIADQLNHRIQQLFLETGFAQTLEFSGSVSLNKPLALFYAESRGRLYVGEAGGQKRLLALDILFSP